MIQEFIQLDNCKLNTTNLCKDCVYCIVHDNMRECENDKFSPVDIKKSRLYTSIEFDCVEFIKR